MLVVCPDDKETVLALHGVTTTGDFAFVWLAAAVGCGSVGSHT
jgi:hypothetical protein